QPQPFGLRLKKRHSALLVAHLESPNLSPRALIGAFSGTTGRIGLVLTGPNCHNTQRLDDVGRGSGKGTDERDQQ
ncbi:MAG: hypothetical protein N0C90_03795, partial [Candidatus Thiodiazotropha endolucinida]|nr:hypothetical protein [Candidatus Thiodiazotropha taylori]MCW4260468.1 hypothetical protein [Candidatus Thiodiazotropha endolucinida]